MPTIYVLEQKKKKKKYHVFFNMKFTINTAVKYCSILHGDVCEMVMIVKGIFLHRSDTKAAPNRIIERGGNLELLLKNDPKVNSLR